MIKAMKVDLQVQVDRAAKQLFRNKLEKGEISFHLISAGDPAMNWELAETLEFLVTDSDHVLRKKSSEDLERYLYEKTYEKEFNPLETEVAWYLDGEKAVHWCIVLLPSTITLSRAGKNIEFIQIFWLV